MSDFEKLERFYKEMIEVCDLRIDNLHNRLRRIHEEDEEKGNFNVSFDFNTQNLNAQRLSELKRQLTSCPDPDLLAALRDEFARQLKTQLQRMTQQKATKERENITKPEHHYFLRNFKKEGGDKCSRFCHFDGPRIVREMFLSQTDPPLLLIAGRDDLKMCQWNIEEARVAEELGDKITEAEFNSAWFDHGGYPYVRPTRKVRRFLTSALTKK